MFETEKNIRRTKAAVNDLHNPELNILSLMNANETSPSIQQLNLL